MFHRKGASTTWPCASEVFGASVRGEMLVQLVLGDKRLGAARTLEGLVAGVGVDMPHQFIRCWERTFVAALPRSSDHKVSKCLRRSLYDLSSSAQGRAANQKLTERAQEGFAQFLHSPLADKSPCATDMMSSNVIVQRLGVFELLMTHPATNSPVTAVASAHQGRSACQTRSSHRSRTSRCLLYISICPEPS